MKSKTIQAPAHPDSIPDVVKEVLSKPGFYIGSDPAQPGAFVPLISRNGIIYSMKIDRPLSPDGFIPGTNVAGPFNP